MNLLFVCTGNTCRSLFAEGYARKLVNERGLKNVTVNSCGTFASSKFFIPKIVLKLLSNEGVNVSEHISTPVTRELVEKADLIFAMEQQHVSDIVSLFPSAKNKTHLFKEYAGDNSCSYIPDPIGQTEEVYAACADEIKKCMKKIFAKLTLLKNTPTGSS